MLGHAPPAQPERGPQPGAEAVSTTQDAATPAATPQVVANEPVPAQTPPPVQEPGDIVVVGRNSRGDPLEGINTTAFAATQAADDAVVAPAARAYGRVVPRPVRMGIRNFLANFREPVVFANYLFQLKPGKAAETLGRFAINTTIGVAGVIDVAKRRPFRLPRRRNSFANTLGYYGVGPGPFFFLPLIGSTTLRDLIGLGVDQVVVPVGPIRPLAGSGYTLPIAVASALDYRLEIDEDLTRLRAKDDPYAAVRTFYLQRRQAEIDGLHGPRRRARVLPPPVRPTLPDHAVAPQPVPAAAIVVPSTAMPMSDASGSAVGNASSPIAASAIRRVE